MAKHIKLVQRIKSKKRALTKLDLKYTRTLTPKWIVFIFLNLWKLGEGGKMDKVLVMLAAGNAARKVNSIQKTMSFSLSSQKGGYNVTIYFFFILQLFFGRGSQRLQKTVSVALQFNPAAAPSMGVG